MIKRKCMYMILSRINKDNLIRRIAKESNVGYKKHMSNRNYIFNRPMTYSQICRNNKHMRLTRTLFALYITLAGRIFNIHSKTIPIFQQTCLVIIYFFFTLVFAYQNFIYFKKLMIKYYNYNISINAIQCALAEIFRDLHYISLPIMFTLVIFKVRKKYILISYAVSIFVLFISNMFDKYDDKRSNLFKLSLFILTIILFDIFYEIESYLNNSLKSLIHIFIVPCMIFCSIFIATQIKCLYDVIEIPFKAPSWINKLPDCFFYTTLYLSNLYQLDILNSPIICINVLLSIACLFKPFLLNSFQLFVEDEQNKEIMKNLETVFSMFKLLVIPYTSFEEYRNNLQIILEEIRAGDMFKGLIDYLGNVKSSEPESLVKVISDFSKLKPNKNIMFIDGLFVYSHLSANFDYTNENMKEVFTKNELVELKEERLRNCILIQYLLKKYHRNTNTYLDVYGYIEECLKSISKEKE